MMPRTNAYSPAAGSLAANVGAYLKNAEAGTLLTTADVARRFQVPSSSVQASLDPAVRSGFLQRDVNSGSSHYRAGKLLAAWTPAPSTGPAAAPTQQQPPTLNAQGKTKRPVVRLADLPDPASLTISADIPLPAPRSANVTGTFEPVYLKLKVGESFEVPADKQKVFQRMGVELGRKHQRRFATRQLPNGTCRVWRLADDVAGNRLAEGKSELTGLLGGPTRSEKE